MFKSVNGGQLPQRATKYSVGFDVYSNEDVVIGAGETKLIGLGIALDDSYLHDNVDIWAGHLYQLKPNGLLGKSFDEHLTKEHQKNFDHYNSTLYFALHIRSSLRAKGLTSLGTGIIDMDYRDEIKMVIHNPFNYFEIQRLDAIRAGTRFDTDTKQIIRPNPSYEIKKGDKIGQLILCRHEGCLLPSEYTKDEERDGGFGSTGA